RQRGSKNLTVVFEVFVSQQHVRGPLPKRDRHTSVAAEWTSLGLNCGGAVLAWLGVVGTALVAPETGGASLYATSVMYTGAVASTGQCGFSIYRVYNIKHGREDRNQSLDDNKYYIWGMRAADGVAFLGAGGAFAEYRATRRALEEAGVSWLGAATGGFKR